jgi:hypothetical protein
MKKRIILLGLIFQFSLLHAADHALNQPINRCADLVGTWEGSWHGSNQVSKLTEVTFLDLDKKGYFRGYYFFKNTPQSKIYFSGHCTLTEAGFEQLDFQPKKPESNTCAGLYNHKKELWMGCPFVQSGGVYHKK